MFSVLVCIAIYILNSIHTSMCKNLECMYKSLAHALTDKTYLITFWGMKTLTVDHVLSVFSTEALQQL